MNVETIMKRERNSESLKESKIKEIANYKQKERAKFLGHLTRKKGLENLIFKRHTGKQSNQVV